MRKRKKIARYFTPVALGITATVVLPAQALGKALVRFIHAVPGVGAATVELDTGSGLHPVGSVGFGQVSPWLSVRSGSFRWALASGGKTLVRGTATVGDGAFDVVVLDKTSGVTLGVYKDEAGKPGTSLVRVIHAAPELGSPELTLDSRPAAKSLDFTAATPYLSVSPGAHVLGAMKPGTNTALLRVPVKLLPDVAYSAIVVGSRGQMVRVVTVTDKGAPLTRRSSSTATGTTARRGSIVVRSGDSLWSIARSLLPAGASDAEINHKLLELWSRNERRIGTGDPSLVFAGTRLLV